MIKLHGKKLFYIAITANLILLVTVAIGDIKPWGILDWLDIVGEGGAALFSLLWIMLVLSSRPAGRVTNLLVTGLTLIFISGWQDVLDEVVKLPPGDYWGSMVESLTMPTGIVLLTFGLFQWRNEQLAINEQLRKREFLFRDHRNIDAVTQTGGASYFRRHLEAWLEDDRDKLPVTLLLLDVDSFAVTNRQLGMRDGDRLLHEIAELLILNLRRSDLLCRYAGDRYAIILPATGEQLGRTIAAQLRRAVAAFAFKTSQGETVYSSISTGLAMSVDDTAETLEERANRDLARNKEAAVSDSKTRAA